MELPKLVCVVGPTASGKSGLAVRLAREFNGEVVSADSMQVYRGLDIGTAKITQEQMRGVAHHMIDVVAPDGAYNAADYCRDASSAIAGIRARGHIPIVAGGTGLYVDGLLGNIRFDGEKADAAYRTQLQNYVSEYGPQALHEKLAQADPAYAEKTHANNVKRVIRALEVMKMTGTTMTELAASSGPARYDCLKIGLCYADRAALYRRIDRRVDEMMEHGLLDEVDRLLASGVSPQAQSMQGIGYKELLAFRFGEISLDRAVELIKQNSRNYAKRQLTWFRRDASVVWFDVDVDGEKIFDKIKNIMENFVST